VETSLVRRTSPAWRKCRPLILVGYDSQIKASAGLILNIVLGYDSQVKASDGPSPILSSSNCSDGLFGLSSLDYAEVQVLPALPKYGCLHEGDPTSVE
jgi:hypothetical protein